MLNSLRKNNVEEVRADLFQRLHEKYHKSRLDFVHVNDEIITNKNVIREAPVASDHALNKWDDNLKYILGRIIPDSPYAELLRLSCQDSDYYVKPRANIQFKGTKDGEEGIIYIFRDLRARAEEMKTKLAALFSGTNLSNHNYLRHVDNAINASIKLIS